jgi:hypothetical protein
MVVNQIKERVLSIFSDLHFEEKRHIYTLDGVIIPSVSKLVESHCDKFDADKKITTRYGTKTLIELSADKASREEGRIVTPGEIRNRWNKKRDDRCDIGHDTHSFMEYFDGSQRPLTPWQVAGVKFFMDMSDEYDVLFREIRMYSRKYRFAGTEDLILIHKKTGHLIAADYKTNEDLFKNYKGKTLKEPFDWALETPYNKYQIQLSYYQIMLEEACLHVQDRWLVYLREDGTYKVFSLLDLTETLREVLNNKVAA